jgi:hypothetical protein
MTAHNGFPRDMESFALDPSTAEGLMTGVVDADDAPPEYRAVARTLQALRSSPENSERAGEPAAVQRIAAAVVRRARPTRRARRARRSSSGAARLAAAAVVAGVLCLTGGFASAGSLPEPAQTVASAVLGTVGISVPSGGENRTVVDTPPATTSSPSPTSSGQPSPAVPEPDVATPPDLPSATAPGNVGGTKANETPPSPANDQGNGRSPNGPAPAEDGNGHGR